MTKPKRYLSFKKKIDFHNDQDLKENIIEKELINLNVKETQVKKKMRKRKKAKLEEVIQNYLLIFRFRTYNSRLWT